MMFFESNAAIAALAQTGPGIRIPFDPATDVVYVLVGLTVFLVWYGDRRTRRAREEEDDSSTSPAGREAADADEGPERGSRSSSG